MDFTVRRATIDDRDAIAVAAARSFTIDPYFGWLGGTRLNTHRILPSMMIGILHDSITFGECWTIEVDNDEPTLCGIAGMAAWFSPGMKPHGGTRAVAIAARGLRGVVGIRRPLASFRLTKALENAYPDDEHYYLQLLALDPEWQRHGLGSALIRPGLDAADTQGLPCYLETQRFANLAWYERFGFKLREVIELPGTPKMWTMLREPG